MRLERRLLQLGVDLEARQQQGTPALAEAEEEVRDDMLRLVFMTCHPALSGEARVALTLRLLGGLTTAEIARAFLVPEPTIAQRIVRAKRTLAREGVQLDLPEGPELAARLTSVLEVVYLVFNEGYAATAGPEWTRPALCEEALRLGRILAELVPDEPEAHGLISLMELQASRLRARALGPHADPARPRSPGAGDAVRTPSRSLRAPGGHRCLPRPGALPRRDRLGPHRRGTTCSQASAATSSPSWGAGEVARLEFERAASLTENAPERALLLERAAACAAPCEPPAPPPAC